MKTSLIIPIHSFVDVITNSSSEIFVSADQNTVKAIKKLVDNIISASAWGNDQANADIATADDLFDFELVYICTDDWYAEVMLTKAEMVAKRKEVDEIINNPDKYTEEQVEGAGNWCFGDGQDDGDSPQTNVRVTVKDKTNKNSVSAAKVLSDLTGLFSISERYN